MKTLKLGLLQADLKWHDPAANRKNLERMIRSNPGHDLYILPEMFSTGFTMNPEVCDETPDGDTVNWMKKLSTETGSGICGSIAINDAGQFKNTFFFVDEGYVTAKYSKRHSFRMAGEHEVYTPGESQTVVIFRDWRIALQVCYDLRFPVWSRYRDSYSYDLLLYVANWPEKRASHWNILLPARAVENQAYVAGVNRVGKDDNGIEYSGDSAVYSPKGEKIVYSQYKEEVLSTVIDRDEVRRFRDKFQVWMDADEFGLRV